MAQQQIPGRSHGAKITKALRGFLKPIYFSFDRNNINNRQKAPPAATGCQVLYDHACPLCRAEMLRLKQHDRHGRIQLVDISDPGFDDSQWGFTREALSMALHVQTADGEWLVAMPAIRHVYRQVGLGWLMAPSGWPLLAPLADRLYRYIAPNRAQLSRWLGLHTQPCNDDSCNVSQANKRRQDNA